MNVKLNRRERREVYLSTRRPPEVLAKRAEEKRLSMLTHGERYKLILASGVEIPEYMRQLAREKGWE